jgi:hypothetical protein
MELINPINLKPMSNGEFAIFKAVASKYLHISPNGRSQRVLANTCTDLDRDIKLISQELTEFRKRQDMQTQINFLMYANKLVLAKFDQFDCRDRIEQTRIEDMAKTITKSAITQEKSVLGKSSKENTVYIIIGSLVVLSSLVILLKSKK